MEYEPMHSLGGTDFDRFLSASLVEQGVRDRLSALDKGAVLKVLLVILPVVTTIVSLVGGLFTVYASSDCQGTDFGTYSRTFLYTSIAYTLANTIMDKVINACLRRLMSRPTLAFCTFMFQAAVTGAFLVALVVMLGLVVKTACPSVRQKIKNRLKL